MVRRPWMVPDGHIRIFREIHIFAFLLLNLLVVSVFSFAKEVQFCIDCLFRLFVRCRALSFRLFRLFWIWMTRVRFFWLVWLLLPLLRFIVNIFWFSRAPFWLCTLKFCFLVYFGHPFSPILPCLNHSVSLSVGGARMDIIVAIPSPGLSVDDPGTTWKRRVNQYRRPKIRQHFLVTRRFVCDRRVDVAGFRAGTAGCSTHI